MTIIKKLLLINILTFQILNLYSQKLTKKEFSIVNKKICHQLNLKNKKSEYFIKLSNDTVAAIINYANGFAVVSMKKEFYPLKAFDFHTLNLKKNSSSLLLSILKYDYKKQIEYLKKYPSKKFQNIQIWNKWLSKKTTSAKTDTIGPLLSSLYGQVNCHDNNNKLINVTNYYTPNNYAVGCVALTLTEVLRYYNWPIQGQNTHSYSDNNGSCTGNYSVNYENTKYKWNIIQDKYNGVSSTIESRKALGLLAFQAAVSIDMDFENGGSTSNINRIPFAASHYFRYDMPKYLKENTSDFWTLVDNSLLNNNPVQFAVYTSSGGGHAIVCDGIIPNSDISQRYYHLNMGWWGSSNAWYHIQTDFNAGGYSIIDAAVMQMIPIPQLSDVHYDVDNNLATISWFYPTKIKNPIFELQQKINNGQWQTIADNISNFQYSFSPDINSKYYFRIKTQKNTNWSEEKSFEPSLFASKLNKINLYPTLVKKIIHIKYKNLKNTQIRIYNLSGQIEYQKILTNYSKTQIDIDVSSLPRGMYIANIATPDTTVGINFIYQGKMQ
jgi:hypothetical protein